MHEINNENKIMEIAPKIRVWLEDLSEEKIILKWAII
jgi:hypothetical protein